MAEMAKATVVYQAGDMVYQFPFDYMSKKFVKVQYIKLAGAVVVLNYGSDYTVEGKSIRLAVAGDKADRIKIFRQTSTDKQVTFVDASILKAKDLNSLDYQILHLAEEASDKILLDAMMKDANDVWQAQGLRMANLGDPVEDADAVNFKFYNATMKPTLDEMKEQVTAVTTIRGDVETIKNEAVVAKDGSVTAKDRSEDILQEIIDMGLTNSLPITGGKMQGEIDMDSHLLKNVSAAQTVKTQELTDESDRIATTKFVKALLAEYDSHTSQGLPVGVPFPWVSTTAVPDGTLPCKGQTFSATDYPELAKVYPGLKLPDLRGVTLRGLDEGRGLDIDGADRVVGSYQADAIGKVPGVLKLGLYPNSVSGTGAFKATPTTIRRGDSGTEVTNGMQVEIDGGTETRMKNVGVKWLVYATTNTKGDPTVTGGNATTLGGHPASYFADKATEDERFSKTLQKDKTRTTLWEGRSPSSGVYTFNLTDNFDKFPKIAITFENTTGGYEYMLSSEMPVSVIKKALTSKTNTATIGVNYGNWECAFFTGGRFTSEPDNTLKLSGSIAVVVITKIEGVY